MLHNHRDSFFALAILAVGSLILCVGSSSAFIPGPTVIPPDDLGPAWRAPEIASLYSDAVHEAVSEAAPEQEASSPDSALAISLGGDGYFAMGPAGGFGFQYRKPSLTPYFIGGGVVAAFVAAYLSSEGESGGPSRIGSTLPASDSSSSDSEPPPPSSASDPAPLPGVSLTSTLPPYHAVPEPGAASLMGLALAGLIARRVRRSR